MITVEVENKMDRSSGGRCKKQSRERVITDTKGALMGGQKRMEKGFFYNNPPSWISLWME
jgi:hypothetical protein